MKEIGQQLKSRREEMKLSISEISMSTKINARIIKAMEEGDMANLPAKTFLRGFVRTYSNYLKLDTESILEAFLQEMGSTKPQPTHTEEGEPNESWLHNIPILSSTSIYKKLGLVSILVALTIVSVVFKRVYDKYDQERAQNNQAEKIQSIQINEPESSQKPQLENKPEETVAVEPAPNPKPPVIVEKVPTPDPVPKPEAPVQAVAVEAPKEEVKAEEIPFEAPTIKEEVKPKAPTAHEIIVEALDDVQVDYRIDGAALKSKKMKADQTFVLRANSEIAIDFSDGGSINIIHNGVDKGVPGNLGIPKKVKFQ